MTDNKAFKKAKSKNLKTLTKYVPVVARVHGESHPEFYEVQKIFDEISDKIKEAGRKTPDLDGDFAKLRKITDGYTVPDDVCETYEAVYTMLKELDKSYQI